MDYKKKLDEALSGISESRFAKYSDKQLYAFENLSVLRKGVPLNKETKEKLRNLAKITKQYLKAAEVWSKKPDEYKKEVGKKSGLSRIGRKADDKHKKSISNGVKGKPKSEEHRKKLSDLKKGTKMSDEQKKLYKLLFKGERNPMYGKNHSEDSRKKISENNKGYHVVRTCPHCGKIIKGTNYFRHHGDKCKFKL